VVAERRIVRERGEKERGGRDGVMSKETTSEDGATTTPKLRAKRHTTRPKYLEDFAEVGIAPRRGKK
jgi:hypothetical protein